MWAGDRVGDRELGRAGKLVCRRGGVGAETARTLFEVGDVTVNEGRADRTD